MSYTDWPVGSILQLGDYIEKFKKENNLEKVYGIYVIGKGDLEAMVLQILGSKHKDSMRLINYQDLVELMRMKDQLAPVVGEEQANLKTQNLLFPIESKNWQHPEINTIVVKSKDYNCS